jgi:hypothetical protein
MVVPMHRVASRDTAPAGAPVQVREPCDEDCPNQGNGDTVWYLVNIPPNPYSVPPGLPDRHWVCSGLSPDDFNA